MIISASTDYRAAKQRNLPFLFPHYYIIDVVALTKNIPTPTFTADLAEIALNNAYSTTCPDLNLETELFGGS